MQRVGGARVRRAGAAIVVVLAMIGVGGASSVAALEFQPAAVGFTDVPSNHPFATEIDWMSGFGVAQGYPDGTYRPTGVVTRQSIAAFLYRQAGSPDGADPSCSSAPFPDVPTSHPFCGEIKWLVDQGIAGGYADGGFHPADAVSRQSEAAFLYRFDGSPAGSDPACSIDAFPDVPAAHPFCGEITWMVDAQITQGYPDLGFHAADPVTRQSAAAFADRFYRRSHLGAVAEVGAGSGFACARTTAGAVYCWGANGSGQLGNGATVNRSTPVLVSGLGSGVVDLDVGAASSCVALSTGIVKCWGSNAGGQLGDNSTTTRTAPVSVINVKNATEVAVGVNHACAIVPTGVKCWGANASGQLGDSTTTSSLTAVDVSGIVGPIAHISAGSAHTCGVDTGGVTACWGNNAHGQLGNGTTTSASFRVIVPSISARSIAAGYQHTCAVLTTGIVRCWGDNAHGELGDGTTTEHHSPTDVPGLTGMATVSANHQTTCVVSTSADARCWGVNGSGQVGDGTTTNRTSPTDTVVTAGMHNIGAGENLTCAVVDGNYVWCWGSNTTGGWGVGTTTGTGVAPEPVFALLV